MINPTAVSPQSVNNSADLALATRLRRKDDFVKALAEGGKVISNMDLSGMDLSGLHLTGLTVRGCLFKGAIMCGATFTAMQLEDADFSGADMSRCVFKDCAFFGCDFSDAKLCETRMESDNTVHNCVFNRADLRGICIMNTKFSRVYLVGAKESHGGQVWNSGFVDVSFAEAKLRLLFAQCAFQNADFVRTDFSNARFLSCAFQGPIDFQGCEGFEEVTDATLAGVNLLSLEQLPFVFRQAERYEKLRLHHGAHRPLWKAVVEGREEDEKSPTLCLTDRLARYMVEIEALDAQTRRYFREKVSILVEFMPETSAACALFRKIEKIDDAMTEKEAARTGDRNLPSLFTRSAWSEENVDADFDFEIDESWSLSASEASFDFLSRRSTGSDGTLVGILNNFAEHSPSDSLVVNTSLRENSTCDLDHSEG